VGNLRVLVADDHGLARKGVRALLEEQPGWEIVAEASNGREAVEKAKLLQPDVTILDLSMPELNGLEAAREILKSVPTKILILTIHEADPLDQANPRSGSARIRAEIGRRAGSGICCQCAAPKQDLFHAQGRAAGSRRLSGGPIHKEPG
jgi:CheY-like chemotaxis protein